jgi:integrating conjugative element protein (TIGR03758 family)
MNLEDSLSAFQSAAGVSPDKISLLIRTVLLALSFVWAAWCIYGEIHHLRHENFDIDRSSHKILRILLIVSLMVILVFI